MQFGQGSATTPLSLQLRHDYGGIVPRLKNGVALVPIVAAKQAWREINAGARISGTFNEPWSRPDQLVLESRLKTGGPWSLSHRGPPRR